MKTTVVRPADAALRDALWVASGFGVFLVLFHVALTLWVRHEGYGYFRDEFYYLMCGRHLAWGYVDQGPMVALQARAAETLFGRSLVGIRMFAAIAGGLRVFLTGMLAWSLGGKRAAQVLAMIGVMVAPQYLGGDSYLSMNSWESVFWMSCLLALVLVERGGSERLWLVFGVSAGLGLLNKPSMTFFLVAVLVALVATPQRRLLKTPWMLAGVGLMLVIVAPNLLWQIHNHWPTLEFLKNGRAEHKNVILGPLAFLNAQFTGMHPVNVLIWGAGLVWLLRRAQWRWLGVMYLVFLAITMALHAKDYYVVPVYPVLFAAGGLAWESWRRGSPKLRDPGRMFGFPVLEGVLVVTGLLILPMSNPVMAPPQWLAYTRVMHLYDQANKTETMANGPLPQFYADRFGWQEEVDQVERAVASLSPEDRSKVAILCSNYGEASALNFLGNGIPVAISGHNNYWLWGPNGATGEVVIVINGATPEEMREYYRDVQVVGTMGSPWAMPYENRSIYLARGRKANLTADWGDMKHYI
jgi:hypothetical protein